MNFKKTISNQPKDVFLEAKQKQIIMDSVENDFKDPLLYHLITTPTTLSPSGFVLDQASAVASVRTSSKCPFTAVQVTGYTENKLMKAYLQSLYLTLESYGIDLNFPKIKEISPESFLPKETLLIYLKKSKFVFSVTTDKILMFMKSGTAPYQTLRHQIFSTKPIILNEKTEYIDIKTRLNDMYLQRCEYYQTDQTEKGNPAALSYEWIKLFYLSEKGTTTEIERVLKEFSNLYTDSSKELMWDPVLLSSGYSVDINTAKNIFQKERPTCPYTGKILKGYIPDISFRQLIHKQAEILEVFMPNFFSDKKTCDFAKAPFTREREKIRNQAQALLLENPNLKEAFLQDTIVIFHDPYTIKIMGEIKTIRYLVDPDSKVEIDLSGLSYEEMILSKQK